MPGDHHLLSVLHGTDEFGKAVLGFGDGDFHNAFNIARNYGYIYFPNSASSVSAETELSAAPKSTPM